MRFLVLGYDGDDTDAKQRRQAARPAHLALGDTMVANGHAIFGVAMLNDSGDMIGSAYVVDFPDRMALDAWLAEEPYVKGKVWQRIEITPCKIGPSFKHLLNKPV